MDFTKVITQILILFIVMFLGYSLRKRSILSSEGTRDISSLIFYVAMPALILSSTSSTELTDFRGLGEVFIATGVSYTFFLLMTFILPKIVGAPSGSVGLYKYMTVFANAGFIGFPMLIAILGESTLFYGAIHNIPFNLLMYTVGIYFMVSDHKQDEKFEISYKNFLNPGIIATFIGLGMLLMGIKLPSGVSDLLSLLGGITTPLAMMVIGASLYGVELKGMLTNRRVIVFSILKMISFPLIIGLILTVIGLSPTIVAVSMVLAGMPNGTTTVIIATQYDANVLEASEAVFLSTLLMVITTPALILFINLLT